MQDRHRNSGLVGGYRVRSGIEKRVRTDGDRGHNRQRGAHPPDLIPAVLERRAERSSIATAYPCRTRQGGALADVKALKALGEGIDGVLCTIGEAGEAECVVLQLRGWGLGGSALAAEG